MLTHDATRAPFVLDRSLFGSFDRFAEVRSTLAPMIWTPDEIPLTAYDVVIGHFSLSSLLTAFEPDEIAMNLREPRSRLLSHYSYWRSWTDPEHQSWSPYDASLRARELGWSEFLDEESIAAQIDNVAVRLLVGPDPRIPSEGFIEPADLDELVARALVLQRSLGVVDVIERGDRCWANLGQWLGRPLIVARDNETSRSEHSDIELHPKDPVTSRRLDRLTAGDRVLWADAASATGPTDTGSDMGRLADETWMEHVARLADPPRSASGRGSPAS